MIDINTVQNNNGSTITKDSMLFENAAEATAEMTKRGLKGCKVTDWNLHRDGDATVKAQIIAETGTFKTLRHDGTLR